MDEVELAEVVCGKKGEIGAGKKSKEEKSSNNNKEYGCDEVQRWKIQRWKGLIVSKRHHLRNEDSWRRYFTNYLHITKNHIKYA